jgi:membrane protease YdiL (CAAX protease family)
VPNYAEAAMGDNHSPPAGRASREVTVAVLLFAMTFPAAAAWTYARVAASGPPEGGANALQQYAYTLAKVIQFGLPVAYLWATERRLSVMGRPRFDGWPVGVAFGLAVAAATLTLYYGYFRGAPLLAGTPAAVRGKLHEFGVDSAARYALLAGFIVLTHSLLEEYYWRWFVFGRLRQLLPVGAAITLSSLAFAAHHVVVLDVFLPGYFFAAVLPFSLAVAVGGAVWAWLYDRAGSVYPAWISHALVDAALFVVGWDLFRRGGA